MEHCSHIPRVRSFLEVPSLFGTRDRFCGRHVFHRLRSGEWFQDDSRFKHVIYCALYFQSGAAGDLTRGTDLWPGGWGPGLTSYRTAWFTCPRQDSEISSLFPRSWKKLQWLLITYNTERGFLSSSSSALDCLVFTSLSSHGSYYSLLHPWPKSRQATLSCVFLELLGDMPAPDLCSVCSVSLGPFTCFRPASLWKCQFTCHRLHETVFHRSVHFSRSVVSNSLRPHGLQHARPPCPSPTPGVYSNSCPLSQWCHPTISSSVIPFSCHQSSPASESFQMSQFFASGGQSIGVSASTSVQSLIDSTKSISFFDSPHFPCTALVSPHHLLPWFEAEFYFLSDIMNSWRAGTLFS